MVHVPPVGPYSAAVSVMVRQTILRVDLVFLDLRHCRRWRRIFPPKIVGFIYRAPMHSFLYIAFKSSPGK